MASPPLLGSLRVGLTTGLTTKSLWTGSFGKAGLVCGLVLASTAAVLWLGRLPESRASGTRPCTVLRGHSGRVNAVAFAPDGQTLATGAGWQQYSSECLLWDLATGRQRAAGCGHQAAVNAVAFAPDGQTLATGSSDGTVHLTDLVRGRPRRTLPSQRGGIVLSLAFSPEGRTLVVGGDWRVTLWDVATGRQQADWPGRHPVAFAPDGQRLACAGKARGVQFRELATGWRAGPLLAPGELVFCLAYGPDGRTFATASDENIRLWDLDSRECRATLHGHTMLVLAMAFAPDGQTLATASEDHTVRLWEVATGREAALLDGHAGPVNGLAFSPDGKWLATVSQDETVRLWDLAAGQE